MFSCIRLLLAVVLSGALIAAEDSIMIECALAVKVEGKRFELDTKDLAWTPSKMHGNSWELWAKHNNQKYILMATYRGRFIGLESSNKNKKRNDTERILYFYNNIDKEVIIEGKNAEILYRIIDQLGQHQLASGFKGTRKKLQENED